jgi:hypothetical protein
MLKPNVSHCVSENEVHYNPIPHDYKKDYFTIESLEDNNTIYWEAESTSITKTISASTDNGQTWTAFTASYKDPMAEEYLPTEIATLNVGEKALIKGENSAYATAINTYNRFKSTKQFEVKGNIMSLVSGDSFANADELTATYTFGSLFRGCTGLTSAENLVLPATTLAQSCYESMFRNCTRLTSVPSTLPADTLVQYCYRYMFQGCIGLTTAPKLLATTLANQCCRYMFAECTSLTTAPELPSTTLATSCYDSMFSGCTSLTTAPQLPSTTLASGCYQYMFDGCTSLTTAPELPATTLASQCYSYMFQGCTSLTTAPNLPATTLANYCYWNMFSGCTNLNYIKCLATDISATLCTNGWVKDVASSGTFIKAASITEQTWGSGVSGIPTGWTVQDAS